MGLSSTNGTMGRIYVKISEFVSLGLLKYNETDLA
jgi:hypothetical protein